jgi:aconitate hydratase
LKKQGVLPLTFVDTDDYEKIQEDDRIDLEKISAIAPGSLVTAVLHHRDGSSETLHLKHSLNDEQIDWFRAGSALNHLRAN